MPEHGKAGLGGARLSWFSGTDQMETRILALNTQDQPQTLKFLPRPRIIPAEAGSVALDAVTLGALINAALIDKENIQRDGARLVIDGEAGA